MTGPQPYDEKVRLAEIIGDARKLLAASGFAAERTGWAARCGRLEAMLKMLADSAEVFTPYAAGPQVVRPGGPSRPGRGNLDHGNGPRLLASDDEGGPS